MTRHDGGKGDKQIAPQNQEQFEANWDTIFNKEPRLLANRIITPDGTVLQSYHRHNYKTYIDANGKEYMIDGGLDYQRCNVHDDAPYLEASVYDNDPHTEIRAAFHWGCRGKDGRSPLEYRPVCSLSNMHIHNIRMTQTHIPEHIAKVFADEEIYRRDNGIVIEDTE
jgi:hypothetical protein